mgnify:CR=1 FL=1
MGIASLAHENLEADDLLGSLARVETAAGEPQGRVTPGRSIEFVAIGRFSDDSEAQIVLPELAEAIIKENLQELAASRRS